MIQVNAMGDACPIPVVKTKNAIKTLSGGGIVETLVDNEIAVQNLTKMAQQKGYAVKSEKLQENAFKVTMTIGEGDSLPQEAEETSCILPAPKQNTVVVISSDKMGDGAEKLGKALLKSFFYALSQQDTLPATILFYNGGAAMSCSGSPILEDLKSLHAQGVEVLTCGTCLDFYGLTKELAVGEVTNMYVICEKLTGASLIVKP